MKSALGRLVTAGWIKQTSKGGTPKGGGTRVASTYRCTFPGEHDAPVHEMHGSARNPRARVPVHVDPATRAPDAHHLDHNLEQDPVCVAFSKLNVPRTTDSRAQRRELEAKLKGLVAIHGGSAVFEALCQVPPKSMPFAGVLVTLIENLLPGNSVAGKATTVEPRGGVVPGHIPSPTYARPFTPALELDANGYAVPL